MVNNIGPLDSIFIFSDMKRSDGRTTPLCDTEIKL